MASFPSLITLCGFMGTGKSAVGKSLSLALRYQFFDSDREIQAREARSIQQIFETEGEEHFRKIEKETLSKFLSKNEKTVLSVGGGAILDKENFQLLASSSVMILLSANVDEIVRRLGHENERPLLQGGDRRKKIEKLLQDRKKIYSKVKIQIDTSGLAIDEVVQKIIERLKKEYP
ncbi:MAG: shikimate kinase [Deltaproteobacteria bacterium]|nr:shikimate kinase [Deltaproteobacteria bacterium]